MHVLIRRIRAVLTGLAGAAAFAVTATAAEVERLVVVGSRAEARTISDTSAPVDVITGAQIARTGITETARLLQTLIPSFNFSVSTISDGTDAVRPATLRGLYPDQVLVLINGKRRHNSALVHINGSVGRGSAGTDLNAIPASAIERIEVLRDGAAAQYGSDAIAGIINIVLKRGTGATDLFTYFGETYEGDGAQRRYSFNTGLELANGGFVHLAAERRDRNRTNRAGDDPRCQYSSPCDTSTGREAAFDRKNHRFGDAESDNDYLFFNSELPIGDVTFYAFGGLSRRDTKAAGFYRRALDARNRPAIYPDGFLPFINTDVNDDALTLGARTTLGAWDVDAGVTHGRNTFEFRITNSLNVSLGDDSPRAADAGEMVFEQTTFNLDATRQIELGLAQPLHLAAGYEYRRDGYEIKAGEEASWINGGVLAANQPTTTSAVPGTPGIQVFPGFRPDNEVDESRHNHAFYVDTETWPLERLRVGAALRYEDYSDFGSDLNGKLSARYELSERLALRATISSGFRAPGLAQTYLDNISTQFNFDRDTGMNVGREVLTTRNDGNFARALGIEALEEENSQSLSLGLVAHPFDRVTLSVDAYAIKIRDRIVLSNRIRGGQIRPEVRGRVGDVLMADYGITNIDGLQFQFFTNAIDTLTRGVDVVAEYAHPFADGATLNLSAAMNVNDAEVSGDPAPPPGLDAGVELFNDVEAAYIETGHPSQSHQFTARYQRGDHDLTLRVNRYGSVTSKQDEVRQTYGARWLADVEYTYHFDDRFNWTIGANNLLDTKPERNINLRAPGCPADPDRVRVCPDNSFRGIFPYSRRTAPFPYTGGFYFTSLKLSF